MDTNGIEGRKAAIRVLRQYEIFFALILAVLIPLAVLAAEPVGIRWGVVLELPIVLLMALWWQFFVQIRCLEWEIELIQSGLFGSPKGSTHVPM